MISAVEELGVIIEAANRSDNRIATIVYNPKTQSFELTCEAGIKEVYAQEAKAAQLQQLETSMDMPAVMGVSNPTVQGLEGLYNAPSALSQDPTAEVNAQAMASEKVTDELNLHLTHTTQAAGVMGVAATIPTSALAAPPELLVAEDVEVELVKPANQPTIVSVSFDKDKTDLATVEQQLGTLAAEGALGTQGDMLVKQALKQIRQEYPELAAASPVVVADNIPPAPENVVAQGNPSMDVAAPRRLPAAESAQTEGGQPQPLTVAAPQVSAMQYQGMGISAAQLAQTSASDITAITR